METLDKTQLLLAGFGVLLVVVIVLWGMRSRIKYGIRKRRRRPIVMNEPVLGHTAEGTSKDSLDEAHTFGELLITRDHYLAEKALIDVEIIPINTRDRVAQDELATETLLPLTDTAPPPTTPPPVSAVEQPYNQTATVEITQLSEPATLHIALTVVAPRGQLFAGAAVRKAAEALGFKLNSLGLFDYRMEPDQEPLFNIAHLRNPGTFAAETMEQLQTSGLLLFMALPGAMEGISALEQLIVIADQLAQALGGMICDEHRQRLSNKGLAALRGQITAFQLQQQQHGSPNA